MLDIIKQIWDSSMPMYFLDTETTGLDAGDEIIDIAIVNKHGAIVLNELIKPSIGKITPFIEGVTGITNDMLRPLRTYMVHNRKIQDTILNSVLITYNAGFDFRMLSQSAALANCQYIQPSPIMVIDFMQVYCNQRHLSKWAKLGDAAREEGVVIEGDLHRALADTIVLYNLVRKMCYGNDN